MRSAYEVLGVTPETPLEAAEQRYHERRQSILELPPEDAHTSAQRNDEIAALDWAWRILSDETSRREHDRWLESGGSYSAQPLGPYGGTAPPFAGAPSPPVPPGPAPGWGPPPPGQWSQQPYPPLVIKPAKRRALPIVLLALVAVLIVGGLVVAASGLLDQIERVDGQITEGGTIALEDLRVGDCFNDPEGLDSGEAIDVFTVDAVPCGQPHDNEVFQELQLEAASGEAYPGDEAASQRALQACVPGFEEFVGITVAQTQLDGTAFYPNEEAWNLGDRRVLCAVYDPAGPTTGTLRGAAR